MSVIGKFEVSTSPDGCLTSITHVNDQWQMNWLRTDVAFGEVEIASQIPTGILTVERGLEIDDRDRLVFSLKLTNTGNRPLWTGLGDIGIKVPLCDTYTSSDICMTSRAHAHVWAGGAATYVMGLRMGGAAPHLGIQLVQGSVGHYRINRDTSQIVSSNDRGIITLELDPLRFDAGETIEIIFDLFWHDGKMDFANKLVEKGRYQQVELDRYVIFSGEAVSAYVEGATPRATQISQIGSSTFEQMENPKSATATITGLEPGEYAIGPEYFTEIDGRSSDSVRGEQVASPAKLLVLPTLQELVTSRCEFLITNQQVNAPGTPLDGAFLVYDQEENHQYYSADNDHNAARERIGMGVLLARARRMGLLSSTADISLDQFTQFLHREIIDLDSGIVANDIGHNLEMHRLYNYGWVVTYLLELFELRGNIADLRLATKVMLAYYDAGGATFYPLEFPISRLLQTLDGVISEQNSEGDCETASLQDGDLSSARQQILKGFEEHCQRIIEFSTSYPASEVNYEQSIVAPAANILLQMFEYSSDPKFLVEAEKHLYILSLFSGPQPHFRLYQTAIRHWDGYWFGKRRLYGDTFPHYWSGLTGRAFAAHSRLLEREMNEGTQSGGSLGDKNISAKIEASAALADASLRGVLSLFDAQGHATCAYVFPRSVNGVPADYADPWANDQDWALYFALEDLH